MGRSQRQGVQIAVAKNNTAEEPRGEGLPQMQQEWLNSMFPFIRDSGKTTTRKQKKGGSNQNSQKISDLLLEMNL